MSMKFKDKLLNFRLNLLMIVFFALHRFDSISHSLNRDLLFAIQIRLTNCPIVVPHH